MMDRRVQELADYAYMMRLATGDAGGSPMHIAAMGLQKRTDGLARELGRRQRWTGGPGIDIDEREDGRTITVAAEKRPEDEVGDELYDVVTIGGWCMTVPEMPPREFDARYLTVNESFGEENHVFDSGLSAKQVNEGVWRWGGGVAPSPQVHFAIAAIPHKTDTTEWPTSFPTQWWNNLIPEKDIKARAIGENSSGAPVTLRLKIGEI